MSTLESNPLEFFLKYASGYVMILLLIMKTSGIKYVKAGFNRKKCKMILICERYRGFD